MSMPFISWFYKTEPSEKLPVFPICPFDLEKLDLDLKELHCKGILGIVSIYSDPTVLPELLRENAIVLKQICDLKIYENQLIEALGELEPVQSDILERSLVKKHAADIERCEDELYLIGKMIISYEKDIFTLLRIELPLLGIDIKQERLIIEQERLEQEKLEQEELAQEEVGSDKKSESKSYLSLPNIDPQLWFIIGSGISILAVNVVILGVTSGAALPLLSKVEVSGLGAGGLALLYYKNYIQEREFDKMHRYVMHGDQQGNDLGFPLLSHSEASAQGSLGLDIQSFKL